MNQTYAYATQFSLIPVLTLLIAAVSPGCGDKQRTGSTASTVANASADALIHVRGLS